jgi:hypothetical protein
MNECLVTKLRGVVEAPELEKLGHIKLTTAPNTSNGYIPISTESEEGVIVEVTDTRIVSVESGVKLSDKSAKVIKSDTAYPGISVESGIEKCNVEISNYYSLNKTLKVYGSESIEKLKYSKVKVLVLYLDSPFNVSALYGINQLSSLTLTDEGSFLNGDFSDIFNKGLLNSFNLYNTNSKVPISIEKLANNPLSSVCIERCTNIQPETNALSLLGRITTLETLRLQGSNFSGTVEEFVASQISSGRTSCQGLLIGSNMGLNVTFNGQPINGPIGKVLSWTSLSDITITNE